MVRKMSLKDIPEADREWIDPETYGEMLDRLADYDESGRLSAEPSPQTTTEDSNR